MSGQSFVAYELYQLMILITQPITVILFIFGTFVITFIFILIFCGFKRFILNFDHFETLYVKNFVVVTVNLLTVFLNIIYACWKDKIEFSTNYIKKSVMKFFMFY